jgi:hypothetical protein
MHHELDNPRSRSRRRLVESPAVFGLGGEHRFDRGSVPADEVELARVSRRGEDR